ncbi:MAG: fibronectin type III domain-containing protein [Verrucomicrobia bacterium]|nr:fibronectin type III domain-containing protein [Verrucomicrobiota bacterium]
MTSWDMARLAVICGALLGAARNAPAVSATDYAVRVSATVQTDLPQVRLSWPADPNATGYVLFRKLRDDASWGTARPLASDATNYVDTNVVVGGAYEYRIAKSATSYYGEGYLYSGIESPLVESRGKVVLLVDNTQSASLADELTRLEQDLVGDGWIVMRHDVARMAVDPANTSPTVWAARSNELANVKALITADYNADPANTKAVFVFGHVPVPYAGNLAPDGHIDHVGAWPADGFYGSMNLPWTDSFVDDPLASSPRNRNVPGDGKLDQSYWPYAEVTLAVGRVDMANLPAFPQSETELLRRYLNKEHNFRHKLITAERRGLIDDHLGLSTGEALAAGGWRNFAAFFGATNTVAGDWLTTLSTQSYLWGYGCGGGTYTSCSGVGSTADFAANDPKVIFTMLFGSYFGDWDSQNNLLRAAIATTNHTLTSVWSGRPHWIFHHMGLGETIGFSTRLTQNNTDNYDFNDFAGSVHLGLMGNPTLRMHIVAPPTAFGVTKNGSGGVVLSWSASPEEVIGYHVYRAPTVTGPFTRLNGGLLTSTTYTDPVVSTNVYMVRAVKLEVSGSGSYYNASQGIFQDLAGSFGPPVLNISSVNGGVTLTWPANSPGYHLEATAAFSPANWSSVTNAVQTSDGLNTAVVNFSGSNQFFRLRGP